MLMVSGQTKASGSSARDLAAISSGSSSGDGQCTGGGGTASAGACAQCRCSVHAVHVHCARAGYCAARTPCIWMDKRTDGWMDGWGDCLEILEIVGLVIPLVAPLVLLWQPHRNRGARYERSPAAGGATEGQAEEEHLVRVRIRVRFWVRLALTK